MSFVFNFHPNTLIQYNKMLFDDSSNKLLTGMHYKLEYENNKISYLRYKYHNNILE